MFGIVNSEIVKVTDKNIQKEIDINTEVLGIVNSEIEKVTNENVQKEIDINTEVLGIFNSEIQLTLIVSNSVDSNFRLSRIFIEVPNFVVYKYI